MHSLITDLDKAGTEGGQLMKETAHKHRREIQRRHFGYPASWTPCHLWKSLCFIRPEACGSPRCHPFCLGSLCSCSPCLLSKTWIMQVTHFVLREAFPSCHMRSPCHTLPNSLYLPFTVCSYSFLLPGYGISIIPVDCRFHKGRDCISETGHCLPADAQKKYLLNE